MQASPLNMVCVRRPYVEMVGRLRFSFVCFFLVLNPVKPPGALLSRHLLSQGPHPKLAAQEAS